MGTTRSLGCSFLFYVVVKNFLNTVYEKDNCQRNSNGAPWRVCRIIEHSETVGKNKYLGVKVI